MTYFKKIDFVLPQVDMSRIVSNHVLEGYGNQFRSYAILDPEYFYDIYSKKIQFIVPPDVVNYTQIVDDGAIPHVDGISTTLNYYVNPANCITVFWKLKDSNYVPEPMLQLQSDGTWQKSTILEYNQSKLQMIGAFRARPGDAYVMSTREIHSVIKPQTHTVREFFRFMWIDLPINEVLKNIEISS